jgi:hypothetical protein
LRNCSHAALLLQIHCASKTARPIESVEEADNDVATDSFINALEASSATKELF